MLRIAPEQAARAVRAATIAEARQVKARAKAHAPRDRPWLATQGIRQKTFRDGANTTSSIYVTRDPEGRNVALYVEFGTSASPPQPFLGPAIAPSEKAYPAAVMAVVDPFSADPGSDDMSSGDE